MLIEWLVKGESPVYGEFHVGEEQEVSIEDFKRLKSRGMVKEVKKKKEIKVDGGE